MRNSRPTHAALLSLAVAMLFTMSITSLAHPQKKKVIRAAKKEVTEVSGELVRLREQLAEAAREYKASLEQLLALYEAEVKRADDRVAKTRELYRAVLVSKRDLDSDELAAEQARAKVARVKEQLEGADARIDHMLVEATSEETARKLAARKKTRERTREGRVYYVRLVIIGEVIVYDYSGAVRGHVIKRGQKVLADSRR